jgi:hypothetical protein
VSTAHYETVDSILLLLAEARERAEGAARAAAGEGRPAALVEALEAADRELLALHKRLFDGAYLGGIATRAATQLELDAA